jgi:hypothetical protein
MTSAAPAASAVNTTAMGEHTIEFKSALLATADEVWAHALTMQGVNEELAPWVRMTVPREAQTKNLRDVVFLASV